MRHASLSPVRCVGRSRALVAAAMMLLVVPAVGGCLTADGDGQDSGASIASTRRPIIGGDVNRGDPAVAALIIAFDDGRQALCSGTLIAPDVVLTAAHCLEPTGVTSRVAYFGSDARAHADDPVAFGTIDVVDFTYDIAFDVDNLQAGHDVGMVRLASSPPGITPVPLNTMPTTSLIGQPMRLVGFGRTEPVPADPTQDDGGGAGVKREVMTTILTFQDAFQTTIQAPDLVAFGSAADNTCQGDSGGPNLVTVGGTEYVAGITSFGTQQCSAAAGTRVDRYLDFIQAYVGNVAAACVDDGICEGACADPDPDCAATQCVADGQCSDVCGNADSDCVAAPSGGGSGSSAGATGSTVSGGCSASGAPASGAPVWLLLALWLWRRRRPFHSSKL